MTFGFLRRMGAVLHARNLEFVRDRATLAWNLILPIGLVVALAVIFGGPERALFKVGVLQTPNAPEHSANPFLHTHYLEFFPVYSEQDAVRKVARHQMDLLLDLRGAPRYWVNTDSPKGYIVEKLLLEAQRGDHGDGEGSRDGVVASPRPGSAAAGSSNAGVALHREAVTGKAVRYVDWMLPGVLGMNIMFGCLFGVGWVVVRYRKNGFLKRLRATPLRAVEFISAQILSRLILTMLVSTVIFTGLKLTLQFPMEGNAGLLFLTAALGATSMIAIGLFIAARFTSEELASGVLNFISWPMMLLSGVWFSLEGSAQWVQWVAKAFPLTQMLEAARAIMLDGAGFSEIAPQLGFLTLTSVLFLSLGAAFFRWRID